MIKNRVFKKACVAMASGVMLAGSFMFLHSSQATAHQACSGVGTHSHPYNYSVKHVKINHKLWRVDIYSNGVRQSSTYKSCVLYI